MKAAFCYLLVNKKLTRVSLI